MSLKRVSHRRTDALARTDWAEVECLLAKYYEYADFEVDHCGTGSGASRYDGGIDLKLRRNGEFIVVQCKHWNAMKVTHNDVHQLIGLMVNEGATGAILITSGEFTRAAIEAATKHGHVQLVDGDDLREMLGALPEPREAPASRFAELMSSDLGQNAKVVARYAGARLLNTAEDRIGEGRGPVRHRTAGLAVKVLIFKAVLGLIVPILIVLAFMGWVRHVFRPQYLTPNSPAATSSAQSPPHVEHLQPDQLGRSVLNDVEAVPQPYKPHQPTPEEIREQQRKAEEAMKIIEATTPELYQGRDGQVRGQ